MSGNVWEWVGDWYGDDYYKNSPVNDPKGSNSGGNRVIRGGSWFDGFCRTSYRVSNYPDYRINGLLGFRIILIKSLEDQNAQEVEFEQNPKVTQNKLIISKTDAEELYVTCASCHGDKGDGNGPASRALDPKPRDFKSPSEKWKNGKSFKGIVKTLKEGIGWEVMENKHLVYSPFHKYDYLREEEINSLVEYVLKLGNQK